MAELRFMIVLVFCSLLTVSKGFSLETNKVEQTNDVDCEMCEVVVREIDSTLSDNATQTKIINLLVELCSKLPNEAQPYCNTIVMVYGKLLIQTLVKELDPHTFCKDIGLCQSLSFLMNRWQRNQLEPFVMNQKQDSAVCELCKVAVEQFEQFYGSPAFTTELNATLTSACMLIMHDVKKCRSNVDSLMNILKMVMSISPADVCSTMTLCSSPSSGESVEKFQEILKTVFRSNSIECELCMEVMQEVDSYLTTHMVHIQSNLSQFCKRLPPPINTKCLDALPILKEFVTQYIKTSLSPKRVCTIINFCSKSQVHSKEVRYEDKIITVLN